MDRTCLCDSCGSPPLFILCTPLSLLPPAPHLHTAVPHGQSMSSTECCASQCLTYRKVLSHSSSGVQTVEIDQAAIWRFLFLSGTFSVRLFVDEDRPNLHVRCDAEVYTACWLLHLLRVNACAKTYLLVPDPLRTTLVLDGGKHSRDLKPHAHFNPTAVGYWTRGFGAIGPPCINSEVMPCIARCG